MPLSTHFWGWDAPVLEKTVAELTRGWKGGALDLSDVVIVVPTGEAVRRLREALAAAVAKKDGAVIAPHVWHPEVALKWNLPDEEFASQLQERLAWSEVLMANDPRKYPALFPQPPEQATMTWASSVAETLRSLRQALGAGGLRMEDRWHNVPAADERWLDLSLIEKAYELKLDSWNFEDSQKVKRLAAHEPALPGGVNRVLVFAVPDAPPLFPKWLQGLPKSAEARIFVHAPENERARFDAFGAPLVSAWGDEAGVVLPLAEKFMHRAAGPEDQARRASALLAELALRGLAVAVGTCDAALNSALEGTLGAAGARVFNPAGRAAREHVLVQVLRDGWRAKHQPAWRAWLPFLHHDDVLRALEAETKTSPCDIIEQLDRFHARHLPATLEDAAALSAGDDDFKVLHGVLRAVVERSELWAQTSRAGAVRSFLEWIYGERVFDSANESDRHFGDLFSKAVELAAEVDAASCGSDSLGLALDALEESSLGDVHGEADIVLHGWLELLWEPARGLVIAGFNDEHVPGVVAVDAFLPDQAREKLGLSCQSRRRARDAYLLRAMTEQRRADAGLHVIFAHVNADGDALRPSRLLLDCEDKMLPARVRHLFPDEKAEKSAAARPTRTLEFQLKPELRPWKGGEISPSQLKMYLACPFRFYLSRVLGMKAVDSGQRELSPGDLGDVMHEVLKAFAESELKHSHHTVDIAGWCVAELEKRTTARYGAQPLFSVALQIESMRQRLRKFAEVQATLREEGWRIIEAEKVITEDWSVMIGGVALNGKIDRVDQHEKTGALRVIDYKTSQSKLGPSGAHVTKAKPHELKDEAHDWKCFDDSHGKAQRWVDLQLPLYAVAAAAKWPDAPSIDAAYLCLPAVVEGIELKEWKREGRPGVLWDQALLDAAKWCAEEAVRRMSAGVFWPPSDDVKYDDFEDLLLGDARAAVYGPEQWEAAS